MHKVGNFPMLLTPGGLIAQVEKIKKTLQFQMKVMTGCPSLTVCKVVWIKFSS